MNSRLILALAALMAALLALFSLVPALDLGVAGYFHDATGFPLAANPVISALRTVFWDASILVPVLALGLLAVGLVLRRPILGIAPRLSGYVLALFLLGPGLLVNGILKAHWGRARPMNVVDFGGSAQFTPAWTITDQCAKNCSFVSGEGAGTMALTITCLLILALWRDRMSVPLYRLGQGAALAMLAFVGFQRVATGGHFLSDVVLSWCLVALIAAVLAPLLPRPLGLANKG